MVLKTTIRHRSQSKPRTELPTWYPDGRCSNRARTVSTHFGYQGSQACIELIIFKRLISGSKCQLCQRAKLKSKQRLTHLLPSNPFHSCSRCYNSGIRAESMLVTLKVNNLSYKHVVYSKFLSNIIKPSAIWTNSIIDCFRDLWIVTRSTHLFVVHQMIRPCRSRFPTRQGPTACSGDTVLALVQGLRQYDFDLQFECETNVLSIKIKIIHIPVEAGMA
jgi:hypothetical protein